MAKYDWATQKQLEGMGQFADITETMGSVDIELSFRQEDSYDSTEGFIVRMSWNLKTKRSIDIHVAWEGHFHVAPQWCFVVGNGDVLVPMEAEGILIEMVYHLEELLDTQPVMVH